MYIMQMRKTFASDGRKSFQIKMTEYNEEFLIETMY